MQQGEFPLVLTPSRLLQPQNEAPGAVTVLDRKLIQATGYRDIPRLLRLVPGMQVGQERGGRHWVTYHGMGNDYPSWMQVLVDGRSVYSPGNFNGVDWGSLPVTIDEIERIEVVRGTNSVAYGANAFLGVVNIITRDSADSPGTQVAVSAGSAGVRDTALETSEAANGGGLRLNAQVSADTGFAGLHDDQRHNIISLRGDKSLDGQNDLMFRLAANQGSQQLGYPDSIFNNNGERRADSLNATFHLQWRHAPAVDEEWLLHFYRNQDRVDESWVAVGPGGQLVPLNRVRRSVRNNLELQHRFAPSPATRVVWGLEARQDEVVSPFLYYSEPRQQSRMSRVFSQLEWSFKPDWSLNASAVLEKFDNDDLYFSPRLFTHWKLSPDDTLRFGYARAWQPPNLFERNGDVRALYGNQLLVQPFVPNPDLRAPRMDSVELGYLAQTPFWHTRFDLRLFAERINDYVLRVSHPEYTLPVLSGILPSARYENLNTPVTLSGIEYQLESRPFAGTRLLFSHTLLHRDADAPGFSRLAAPYTASLSWMQTWNHDWSSTLSLFSIGALGASTGFVPGQAYVSRPYTTLDARLARRFKLSDTAAVLALSATNLGGRHQEIADGAEQSLHGQIPVNQTSPMVWLTLTLNPK